MIGKKIRMERIMDRNSGKMVIVPVDHGMTLGPLPGLIDFRKTIDSVFLWPVGVIVGAVGDVILGVIFFRVAEQPPTTLEVFGTPIG